ncbi:MAG: 3'(2'),5'-bisphosphate nucleotidase CysQ [Gammaproteobacteria bacterium]|nr:3'(2'),5'-bisphosphate nucleotidase CysQ [Gammaproteobacteria bacterium]
MTIEAFLNPLGQIARRAGDAILEIYDHRDVSVQTKGDDSPLTEADLAAHRLIVDSLVEAWPDIPVLSEESTGVTFEERRHWSRYFLVDPLDGTKEFINRNGEFTVNIALVEDGIPIAGVVFVPVKDVLYAGADGAGAWVETEGDRASIQTRALQPRLDARQALTIVASRRHGGEALEGCLDVLNRHFGAVETTNMGSSLKLCLVAAGEADLYPRLAPTSEWDTAAAHAIVQAAGGRVVDSAPVTTRLQSPAGSPEPAFLCHRRRDVRLGSDPGRGAVSR